MITSKLKRYSLFGIAIFVELFASFSFLNLYVFPLLMPALLFCEIMLYLEISNVILLFALSIGLDVLLGEPIGKYTFFIFLFSFMTVLLRQKLLYLSPFKFCILYALLYGVTLVGGAAIFVFLGYAAPTGFFVARAFVIASLLFLPTLSLYAYSFTRRIFYEGRYVKR